MTATVARTTPSPLPPTEAELAAWNALNHEQQIAYLREHLSHPDCDRVSDATMAEIVTEARARAARRRGG